MLYSCQWVLEARWNTCWLKMDRENMFLTLRCEHNLFHNVVRVYRFFADHQKQYFRILERVDDLFAPHRCTIDTALIDPQGNTGIAKFGSKQENALFVFARVTNKYICNVRHCCYLPFMSSIYSGSLRIGSSVESRLIQSVYL